MSRRHSLPAEVYRLVAQTPATVLLECGNPNNTDADVESCTRLFTAPVRVCVANTAAGVAGLFDKIENAVAAGMTAAGFFTYECGSCFEPKAGLRESRLGQPLAWFGVYAQSYRFDHATGTFPDGEPPGLERFRGGAEGPGNPSQIEPAADAALSLTEVQYAERIAAIHELIRSGDVYQLNFTVCLSVLVRGGVAALYARLRERQPVEYGAFLHWQAGWRILSFSPELFFRLDAIADELGGGRRITTKPMKGTAARGRTTREDRERAEWLRNDPKNRSENVMIVDLLRNDLGRLARFGTVRAENLFAVERYPTLWQMTSTVTGDLRAEVGFHDIFRALFPCGSITGAPKVRAMQLLAGLEERPRGVYTGAIGYFSQRRTVFNVAIRTLELDGEHGTMGVGSGIVIDSDAAEEYSECALKAEFLTSSADRFPERFSLIETMLWDDGYRLMDLHLDRLMDSAAYFGFECERDVVKKALAEYASGFEGGERRRVRLLADREGSMNIEDEPLASSGGGARTARAFIWQQRTDRKDPMHYHKTTHRPLYAEAFKEAVDTGFDDVLFVNFAGEVTEGAISNIFIEKDGRWLTPPVECGLLAGVYRRHLLETRSNLEERVLSIDDLRRADAVYLCNAVRGLRRVMIDWQAGTQMGRPGWIGDRESPDL